MSFEIAEFEKISFEQFGKACGTVLPSSFVSGGVQDLYDAITLPRRATAGSAGYDFFSPFDFDLYPNGTIVIPTGIRVKIDPGWFLMCVPRSGSGFKFGVRLMNTCGIIDSDYYFSDNEGHIMLKLHNTSPDEKKWTVHRGDGIAQGIFLQYGLIVNDETSDIRNGGFGSTSKNGEM